jgi:hypothetical protein
MIIAEHAPKNTSPYYSYFQILFETIDTTSFFWQPYLRAVGSSQLEVAGLQARQAQAFVRWAHQVMRPASPMDFAQANAQLWQAMLDNCAEAAPRVAAAANSVTRSTTSAVLTLPIQQSRDTLILLDREGPVNVEAERRVA